MLRLGYHAEQMDVYERERYRLYIDLRHSWMRYKTFKCSSDDIIDMIHHYFNIGGNLNHINEFAIGAIYNHRVDIYHAIRRELDIDIKYDNYHMLHTAAARCINVIVEELLREGADLNSFVTSGRLYYLYRVNVKFLKTLCTMDTVIIDCISGFYLKEAIENKHYEHLDFLLEHKIDIHADEDVAFCKANYLIRLRLFKYNRTIGRRSKDTKHLTKDDKKRSRKHCIISGFLKSLYTQRCLTQICLEKFLAMSVKNSTNFLCQKIEFYICMYW